MSNNVTTVESPGEFLLPSTLVFKILIAKTMWVKNHVEFFPSCFQEYFNASYILYTMIHFNFIFKPCERWCHLTGTQNQRILKSPNLLVCAYFVKICKFACFLRKTLQHMHKTFPPRSTLNLIGQLTIQHPSRLFISGCFSHYLPITDTKLTYGLGHGEAYKKKR